MAEDFPSSKAIYLLCSAAQLPALVQHMTSADNKHRLRLATALHTLGNLPMGPMQTFNEVINQSLTAPNP